MDGSWFGEIAMLHETRRTSSVKSVTHCVLFRIDRSDFIVILEYYPDLRVTIEALPILRIFAILFYFVFYCFLLFLLKKCFLVQNAFSAALVR